MGGTICFFKFCFTFLDKAIFLKVDLFNITIKANLKKKIRKN